MAHSDDKGVKERRLEREAAAKRRDDGFLADKQHAHDETMAKIARLRDQRLAEAARQPAPAARLVGARASKKAP